MKLDKDVAKLLIKYNKTIAVAESLSGGLTSNLLTNTSGSSRYFKLGIVAYSIKSKVSLLDIPKRLINRHGTISSKTCLYMAESIRKIAKTDIGLSVTGIAGPHKPCNTKQPIGLIYVGLASKGGTIIKQFHLKGKREIIKSKAATSSLKVLKEWLIKSGRSSQ